MTKKKKTEKKTTGPQVLNAHAGEYGQYRGTYITYRLNGMTHQAFYNWRNQEFTVLITEIEDKICNIK